MTLQDELIRPEHDPRDERAPGAASGPNQPRVCCLVIAADATERERLASQLRALDARVDCVESLARGSEFLHFELGLLVIAGDAPRHLTSALIRRARRISPLVRCFVVSDEEKSVRKDACVHASRGEVAFELEASVRAAREVSSALHAATEVLVGRVGLKQAQHFLRAKMSQAALARCSGSRRAAASLLEVDRRYVQKLCSITSRGAG